MAFKTRRCLRHFSQPVLTESSDLITFSDMLKKQASDKQN
ncbi:hypothetical protein EcWSU1_01950 [Enterobacter ludwigii]|jgi:hypothetical protein|uniref:Uncharacterized protein n=1 Tax=Enterobacter ludwigii TaxID=299767 RepID=G8LMB5_9ENTR|nr:hypothetical protein EcWSU1_01950 [Enterobacter ludwigii]